MFCDISIPKAGEILVHVGRGVSGSGWGTDLIVDMFMMSYKKMTFNFQMLVTSGHYCYGK